MSGAAAPREAIVPPDERPAPQTPAEMRAHYDARLADSGETPAPFHRDVDTIIDDWLRALPAGVELGAVRCYRDGCSIEQVSDDSLAHEESGAAFADAPAFHAFPGWRVRSGPETDADGRVHATWYFLAPPAD
jgi:hypothetical protein